MENERITESLIKKLLLENGYYTDDIIVEEQSSSNVNINSLLSKASKSGKMNKGFPEFIITSNKKDDFIIIIEAKYSLKYHKSSNLNMFNNIEPTDATKYNLDGLIWYSKFLKTNYNIIGIAVTGNDLKSLEIEHVFIKKNEINNYTSIIKDNKISEIDKYLEIYNLFDDKKIRNDINQLADNINNKLRDEYDFENFRKPLLISMLLIGMYNFENDIQNLKIFKNSLNEKDLFEKFKTAALTKLKSQNSIITDKMKYLLSAFEQMSAKFKDKTSKIIVSYNNKKIVTNSILTEIIFDLYNNIYSLIRKHKYIIDPIGIFYNKFLKYATGEGKDLGIVLTPSHITDLFTELAHDGRGIDLNDKIIDICSGSGGFLISSYKKLINIATNQEQINSVKENNIYGIENDESMFALSLTNMILLGDGKTNLAQKDCFLFNDFEGKANLGFINPPYSKKNENKNEFDFIDRLLTQLKNNEKASSELIAIIPMSILCKDKTSEKRKKLLKKATLKAVISMPDELFSPAASVNTAIIILDPNKPHDFDKTVWMARLKDDGFVKAKHKGRIPKEDGKSWEEIKQDLLHHYKNNEEDNKRIKYVKAKISPETEWSPESFVETDMNLLNDEMFFNKIKNHVSYKIKTDIIDLSKSGRINNTNYVKLNNIKWNKFCLKDIFDLSKINNSYVFTIQRVEKSVVDSMPGHIPYISSSEFENGITATTSYDVNIIKTPVITLANSGSVGSCFFQEVPFIGTDSIFKLELLNKNYFNVYVGLFICVILELEKFRFNYGRAWRAFRLCETKIKLPVDKNGNIDFNFMENYIKTFKYSNYL